MSDLRTIRSFTVEMLKIAADIKDSDVRKLLAERRGKEYLEGGRLPTNTFDEAPPLIKMGNQDYSGLVSGAYNLKARKKKDNTYQKIRDYAASGTKGALSGLAVLGASNALRGRFGGPAPGIDSIRAMQQARRAATIGGSAAVLDRAYRHDELPHHHEKQASVIPNPSRAFRSAASALATSRRTGGFHDRVIHDLGRPPHTVRIGKKFHIP